MSVAGAPPSIEYDEAPETGESVPGRPAWRDLVLCFAIAVLGALVAGLPPPLSVPVALLAVLLVPGYALSIVLLPSDEHADSVQRLALGFGLSLGVLAIVALVLENVGGGMRPGSIRAGVTICSLALLVVAALRRARSRPRAALYSWPPAVTAARSRAERFTRAIVVASLVAAGFAYVVAVSDQPPRPTAFYVLGEAQKIAQYPREASVGETVTLHLGIEQAEDRAGTYEVILRRGEQQLARLGPIAVQPAGRWEGDLSFVADRAGPDQELAVELTGTGEPHPLRTLRLWIDVREGRSG
jgi:uncharacterized membrane protein